MSFQANKLLVNLLRQRYSCTISKLWFNKPKTNLKWSDVIEQKCLNLTNCWKFISIKLGSHFYWVKNNVGWIFGKYGYQDWISHWISPSMCVGYHKMWCLGRYFDHWISKLWKSNNDNPNIKMWNIDKILVHFLDSSIR